MSKRKWNWNFDFFKGRTPEVAYWCGFIMADGCIKSTSKNSYVMMLYIDGKDKSHIEAFCDAVGIIRGAIYTRKEGYVGIHLNHPNLLQDLRFWGVVPRKTYNFVAPNISKSLLPHYLRGWADGDGHIYAKGRGARFTVSGNLQALYWYGDALRELGYSGHISYQSRGDLHGVLYVGGKNQVHDILDLLVVIPNFKLERKWDVSYNSDTTVFTHFCENCGNPFPVSRYRHENEPNYGRFCSSKCYGKSMSIKTVDGKRKCSRCGKMILIDLFSGNLSYCKFCWAQRARERRTRLKDMVKSTNSDVVQ